MHLPKNCDEEVDQSGKNIINENESTIERISGEPDFTDFMWMADEDLDEFDRQVISEIDEHFCLDVDRSLEDEEERFLQRMLHEEEERDTVYFRGSTERRIGFMNELNSKLQSINVSNDIVKQSNLNPNAAEFVPRQELGEEFVPSFLPSDMTLAAVTGAPPSSFCSVPQQNVIPIPLNNPQMNSLVLGGHGLINNSSLLQDPEVNEGHVPFTSADRFFSSGAPVYVPNIPVFPMSLNGSSYIHSPPGAGGQLMSLPDNIPWSEEDGYGNY